MTKNNDKFIGKKPRILKLNGIIGIKTDKNDNPVMSILACLIVSVTLLCLMIIYAKSFGLFGSGSSEPISFSFSEREITLFFSVAFFSSLIISGLHCIKKKYAAVMAVILIIAAVEFIPRYKLIANGFIRAANRVMYSILVSEGVSPQRYYLVFYDADDPKKELVWFMSAVVFGLTLVMSFLGVRRCSSICYAVAVMSICSVPLILNVLVGEFWFLIAFLMCIVTYVINVSDFRIGGKRDIVLHFGKTIRISGKYSAYSAAEQTAVMFIFAGLITLFMYNVFDYTNYKRSKELDQFGRDILHYAEYAASGTFFEQMGFGTSDNLNHGQVSKLGDLHYSGETMFKIKSDRAYIQYLRAFSADVFNGKSWKSLSPRKVNSFNNWDMLVENGYYPQLFQPNAINFYDGTNYYNDLFYPLHTYDIEIVNEAINPKTFLTAGYMLPEYSDEIVNGTAKAKYDRSFSVSLSSGLSDYRERVVDYSFDYPSAYIGSYGSWSEISTPDDENIYEDIYMDTSEYQYILNSSIIDYVNTGNPNQCLYSILHDGDFLEYSSYLTGEDAANEDDYRDFLDNEKIYRQFVLENYLDYPENIDSYLPEYFDDSIEMIFQSNNTYVGDNKGMFYIKGYYDSMESTIRQYLSDQAQYTLSPGKTPRDRDFVGYFLNENHKGYCVHFATVAALMLRRAGIPTRYCEGYIVSKKDLSPKTAINGGYHPIPDSNSHAWVEVYYPLMGWIPVEFTPPYIGGDIPEAHTTPENAETDSDTGDDTDLETDSDTNIDTETDSDTESDTDSDTESESESISTSSDGTVTAPPSKLLKALKSFLMMLLKIFVIAASAVLLRVSLIKLRILYLTKGDERRRALSMYSYSLFLLRLQQIKKSKDQGEEEFSLRISKLIRGVSAADYKLFTATALKAKFGRTPPSEEELCMMYKVICKLSRAAYDSRRKAIAAIIKYGLFLE